MLLKQKWLTCESLPSLTESSATDWASSLQSEVMADMWPPPFLNWAETSLKPSVMVEAKLVIDFVTNKSPLHSSTISDLVTDEEISGIGGSIFPIRNTLLCVLADYSVTSCETQFFISSKSSL